ncbi:MAG: D-alanyl-D-alanine carboxypeptidase/D-alanyl-D-alanine-endopeptidase [Planctomycetes bacterium]|nr:D-alanyl-D-alanine carboxypeptidase/D-alanyl-D-alanine-endopeptidase [Planctomycetota bacterium]
MLRSALLLTVAALAWAADLGDRVRGALAQVPRGGEAAVAVWDCTARDWAVVAGDPGPLRLASTTKLFVAAAALSELGTDFRFKTLICALGQIRNGSIPGLGVIGGGDPTIDEHFWNGDPERCLRQWAERIRLSGVARIDGDLVIDNRLFRGPERPATYPSDGGNLTRWFSAPASAFAFNDNCIDVRAVPTAPGQPCRVETRPRSPRIAIDNRTRTVEGTGDATFMVNRAASANAITVSGSYGRTTAWFPAAIHSDPDLLAGDAFAAALRDAGIQLTGQVRLGPVDRNLGPLLIEHRSELVPAVTLMNQRSQNFYGEQLLRLVGLKRLREGSIAAGARAVREACNPFMGEDAAGVNLLDGSGLSYGNVASARSLCRMLASLDAGPLAEIFRGSLKDKPYAGVEGKIKTGTLATASCLAGYVTGRSGRRAFAILLGQGSANGWGWGPGLRERIYEIIAESVR